MRQFILIRVNVKLRQNKFVGRKLRFDKVLFFMVFYKANYSTIVVKLNIKSFQNKILKINIVYKFVDRILITLMIE